MEPEKSMRQLWFAHVQKVRTKLNRGKNTCSHRDAMKQASVTWPDIKKKIERKRSREAKKRLKENSQL
jgi:hypothetical protein